MDVEEEGLSGTAVLLLTVPAAQLFVALFNRLALLTRQSRAGLVNGFVVAMAVDNLNRDTDWVKWGVIGTTCGGLNVFIICPIRTAL